MLSITFAILFLGLITWVGFYMLGACVLSDNNKADIKIAPGLYFLIYATFIGAIIFGVLDRV